MATQVYRVEMEQHDRNGYLWDESTVNVRARSAAEAIRKAIAKGRQNGFQKSRPIEVREVKRIVRELF